MMMAMHDRRDEPTELSMTPSRVPPGAGSVPGLASRGNPPRDGKRSGALASFLALAPLGLAAAVLAALLPTLAEGAKTAEIDFKVDVSVDKPPVPAGGQGEAVMTLTPPAGIHINRYPPIRLTLEPPSAVTFDATSFKVGLDAMPDDPEKNPFETVDPIRMTFKVGSNAHPGQVPVKGKLKFFYCVAKSGYCAPGNKDVAFSVPVTAAR